MMQSIIFMLLQCFLQLRCITGYFLWKLIDLQAYQLNPTSKLHHACFCTTIPNMLLLLCCLALHQLTQNSCVWDVRGSQNSHREPIQAQGEHGNAMQKHLRPGFEPWNLLLQSSYCHCAAICNCLYHLKFWRQWMSMSLLLQLPHQLAVKLWLRHVMVNSLQLMPNACDVTNTSIYNAEWAVSFFCVLFKNCIFLKNHVWKFYISLSNQVFCVVSVNLIPGKNEPLYSDFTGSIPNSSLFHFIWPEILSSLIPLLN